MNRADVRVILISNQGDGLSVSSVFLNLEGETEFGRECSDFFVDRVGGDHPSILFVEFPIGWDECFNDALPRRVDVFVKGGLGFLCIFCAS